ncbi:MAG TPA: beta-ketoacyl-[acyl-carrier-protein] synthase family protein [Candidatus Deferrimicrobiaceae bacterium]
MRRPVVITGMGIVTAQGAGKETNWTKIVSGETALRPVTLFDTSRYRTHVAGEVRDLPMKKWERFRGSRLDRASHLLRVACEEAVGESGWTRDALVSAAPAVVFGTTLGGMGSGERYYRDSLRKGPGRSLPSLVYDHLAHSQGFHVLEEFSLPGVPVVYSNACASGANAIGHAFRAVRSGEAEVAICGGYDPLCEFVFAGFHSLQALTPELCRPFDRDRSGMALGEGAGVLILEPEEGALLRGARIVGEVSGYGETTDAFHMTRPDPEGKGAAAAMQLALDEADADPAEVGYINAHGTGTPFNDIMESAAIRSVMGARGGRVPVSSTKSMIGHLLGGAGAVEAILTVMALSHRRIPPNANCPNPDPACGLRIVTAAEDAPTLEVALSNSFGFGGANAALVFRAAGRVS